ncbi:MAG: hypothetical protein OXR68_00215 [Alphaproteobacteria bacterium]|nr:hypothetical protein [Alphaproteobacteria bacterium]MDD9919035.1 hypothetical protein [Alphaproteobacteria bacterium]
MSKSAQRIFITGASGSGKSTWVKNKIKECTHLVIFDPLDEYARENKDIKRTKSLKELRGEMRKSWKKGFKLSYVPPQGNLRAKAKALHDLSLFLMAAQKFYFEGKSTQEIHLVVEEMNLSFPITSLPEEYYGFGEICSRGRHYGINVYGIAQRAAEVNTRFRGNCNYQVIFRCADWADVKTRISQLGPDIKDRLNNLQTHYYLKVDQHGITEGNNVI